MSEVRYARKDRRDRVTGEVKVGPTHIVRTTIAQSLCGRRIKGLATWTKTRPEVPLCLACLRHEAAGTAKSWSR